MSKIVDIYNAVLVKSRSISELQNELDIHRDTITKNIVILKKLNLVYEKRERNRRVIMAKYPINRPWNNDTYFNLPIDDNDKMVCHYIFSKLNEDWKIKKDVKPSRIAAQKILTEITDNLGLSIPKGWYMYGNMSICIYDENEHYENNEEEISRFLDTTELNDEYRKVLDKYMAIEGFDNIMKAQYEESENPLYASKLEFEKHLVEPYSDKDLNMRRIDLAYKLLFSYPNLDADQKAKDLLEAFVSCYVTMILNNKIDDEAKILICGVFLDVWNFIATRQFIIGLSNYYDKETIDTYLKDQERTYYQKASDSINCLANITY